jgi:O-antigen/teichoic acid export membrane protein
VIHALSGASFVLVLAYQIALAVGPYAVWVGYLERHWADMSWLLVILGSIGWLLTCPCAQLVCHLQNRLCTCSRAAQLVCVVCVVCVMSCVPCV